MTSKIMPSIIQIDRENLKNLVSEVKETLATDVNVEGAPDSEKKFNLADLTNIQQTMRTAASRRKYLPKVF